MRLRMPAASFSSTSFAAASAASLDEAASCRYWANTGEQQESAKPKSKARERRRVMATDIARTLPARQLRAKRVTWLQDCGGNAVRACGARRQLPLPGA